LRRVGISRMEVVAAAVNDADLAATVRRGPYHAADSIGCSSLLVGIAIRSTNTSGMDGGPDLHEAFGGLCE